MSIYDNLDRDAARAYDAGVAAERERCVRLAAQHQAQYPDPGWGIKGSKRLPFAALILQSAEPASPPPVTVKGAGE